MASGGDALSDIFERDESFWSSYNKGRPQPPESFFQRIFDYHIAHDGRFDVCHDAGAGNGPYAAKLKQKFGHVIVSDLTRSNVDLARKRLGDTGFSHRQAKIEQADDLSPGSVDLVFATNMMHFADQRQAMEAVARQLKPGGTFAAAGFGPARFHDRDLQRLWGRIMQQGGLEMMEGDGYDPETVAVMSRTAGIYNVAPLDPALFRPRAQRIHLNMSTGGILSALPPSQTHGHQEPVHSGVDDVEILEDDDGWTFETDLAGVRQHIFSFPFIEERSDKMEQLFDQLDDMLQGGSKVTGHWPCKIILATRR